MDGPILLHPKVWEASGHTTGFNDAMVDCMKCKKRYRADHLIEEATGKDVEGNLTVMNEIFNDKKIKCPNCEAIDWTKVRTFNMMFATKMNNVGDKEEELVYLRPETAGAIFIEFKNILESMRVKLPFGIAQIGKAFRNEIVAGNFIFRLKEFEQMEIEYFMKPDTKWEPLFENWLKLQEEFAMDLGAKKEDLARYEHPKEKLSHYSKKTIDVMYKYPFGTKELYGLAHRSDFDLSAHSKCSGKKMDYFDPETNTSYIPHVLEPTFGVDRSILVALLSAYHEEEVKGETRAVLRFPKNLAPIKVAILPLSKKDELSKVAKKIFDDFKTSFVCEYDETQSIGKRYRRQDEIGTPYCVTVDFESIDDKKVTVRDRDTMKQERVKITDLKKYIEEKLI